MEPTAIDMIVNDVLPMHTIVKWVYGQKCSHHYEKKYQGKCAQVVSIVHPSYVIRFFDGHKLQVNRFDLREVKFIEGTVEC